MVREKDRKVDAWIDLTAEPGGHWPSHDTTITHIAWCMAHKGRVGGWSYIVLKSRNGIAVVWVMRIGGGYKGMIDSCTHTNK